MKIRWYGHSCFLLTSENGDSVLTDPFAPEVCARLHDIECGAVTVSHGHFDHCYTAAAAGEPVVIDGAGEYDVGGIHVIGFPAFHDKEQGAKRGTVMMYLFEIDGIRLLHAGDVGDQLTKEQLSEIGVVDVLLVPEFCFDRPGLQDPQAERQRGVHLSVHAGRGPRARARSL